MPPSAALRARVAWIANFFQFVAVPVAAIGAYVIIKEQKRAKAAAAEGSGEGLRKMDDRRDGEEEKGASVKIL